MECQPDTAVPLSALMRPPPSDSSEQMEGKNMKKLKVMLVAAATLAAVLTTGAPASAEPPSAGEDPVNGGFQLTVHTHSSGENLLFPEVERLQTDFAEGDTFAYSSRTCSPTSAPFNNLGLDFNPDYPGVDDDGDGTAPVRHQVTGTITSQDPSGTTGTLEGTITTVLCSEDGTEETDNVIVTNFEARYRVTSDDELQIIGQFQISPDESTGTFADLEGSGSIQGVFTCLGATVCSDIGEYTDFIAARGDLSKGPGDIRPGLVGHYSDPTVTTG